MTHVKYLLRITAIKQEIIMQLLCRHRAEKALQNYWQRDNVSIKESATLVTALMNPSASSSHLFLMENIGMHMQQAKDIYTKYAPSTCHCDVTESTDSFAA
jgi:hypothetical protein